MLDHQAIKKINLQRFPIALLDRITEYERGHHIVAIKAVTASEPCYSDLADDAGSDALAYPRSLMLESFCQAAGPLCLHSGLDFSTHTMLFVSMGEVEFLEPVYPGDVMEHSVAIQRVLSDAAVVGGVVKVNGSVVARIGHIVIAAKSGMVP